MRIGLICPYHIFRGGGVQECVIALQSELTKRGHYARIITPLPRDYSGDIPESIITLGASRNTKAFVGTAWQWSVAVDTDAIDEVLQRENFDVLHFHEPWVPVWGRQILMRSSSANIATMHGKLPDTVTARTLTNIFVPYTKPMIKYFDSFTAVSDAATEFLLSLQKVPIAIVPNGIDLKKYQQKSDQMADVTKQKTIFYIGRLEKRKGVKYLLQAFAELAAQRSDIRLHIAGTGPDEKMLHDYVTENKIPRVKFLGFVAEDQKIAELHKAHIFCAPSPYGESFGIVLLEAMAAGIPVVAGDNPGYSGVMQERGRLSLVNPRDVQDFSRRLALMVDDEPLRQLWLDWATNHVSKYDYSAVVNLYEQVYQKAITSHAKRYK